MNKKMQATVVYWGYIGIMEKKMETIGRGLQVQLHHALLKLHAVSNERNLNPGQPLEGSTLGLGFRA